MTLYGRINREKEAMPDDFSHMLTVEEAAQELKLAPSSIRRMISEGELDSRSATPHEQGVLLAQHRIRGVPGKGIRLIWQSSVEKATHRRKRTTKERLQERGNEGTR